MERATACTDVVKWDKQRFYFVACCSGPRSVTGEHVVRSWYGRRRLRMPGRWCVRPRMNGATLLAWLALWVHCCVTVEPGADVLHLCERHKARAQESHFDPRPCPHRFATLCALGNLRWQAATTLFASKENIVLYIIVYSHWRIQ